MSETPQLPSKSIRHDLLASVVVFLVALPLSLGIALASGVPPAVGIITGIVGGIVVGLLAGAPLQVSGPAAGLSVMVYEIVTREGLKGGVTGLQVLGPIVLIAGAIQIAAGAMGLGQWFRAVSPAVIRGMLSGIGILIFGSQFHVMVDDAPKGSGLTNLLSLPESAWLGVVPMDGTPHHTAARIGIMTILIIIAWKAIARGFLKPIPGPLVAVIVATVLTKYSSLPINLVKIPDNLAEAIRWITPTDIKHLLDGQILLAGIAVAFVASAETLLCATAVDKLHRGPRTRYDKELIAQGVGNSICGVLGALPITGVIVRSAANIEAGARSRKSSILHGIWLLIFAVALPNVLRMVPTACLAAILVFTGYKLIDIKALKELKKFGMSEVAIYIATIVGIVAADLLTGVLIGIGLSVAKLLYVFSHLDAKVDEAPDGSRTTVHLRGAATFVRLPQIAAILDSIKPNTELHVHLEKLTYIDHACLDLFIEWEKQHETTGGRLVIDWDNLTARFNSGGASNGDKALRTEGA